MTAPTTAPTLAATAASEIRAALGRQHRSVSWLAKKMGTYPMYVHRRLDAEVEMTLSDIDRMALALGVPVVQLLTLGSAE